MCGRMGRTDLLIPQMDLNEYNENKHMHHCTDRRTQVFYSPSHTFIQHQFEWLKNAIPIMCIIYFWVHYHNKKPSS